MSPKLEKPTMPLKLFQAALINEYIEIYIQIDKCICFTVNVPASLNLLSTMKKANCYSVPHSRKWIAFIRLVNVAFQFTHEIQFMLS